MNNTKSFWLIAVVSVLLISLLVNQITHVYLAAVEQETNFSDKANLALEAIVNEISDDYDVCKSVNTSFYRDSLSSCGETFKSKKEWKSVDSIIKIELKASNIDLKYNFEFCSDTLEGTHGAKKGNTFTKDLNKALPISGILMHLEFPSKSNYVLKQIGPTFISSILIILLISLMFIITIRFYNKEKRNAERTRGFLNNMTHEFKTPLANIAFANNMLAKQSAQLTPDQIKKYTQIIRSENDKMVDSSEDILEMVKQEYDFKKLTLENVDVHDIIYELQKSFIASHTEFDLDISLKLAAKFFTVEGKTSFLQNALSNLIDNAIKYCKSKPKISISTYNENSFLFISIEDNGIGIHKDEIEAIFEKFYRISTGNQHDVKGFGLGLSYVKMVISQMKGTVSIKSGLNKGSIFTIKLPTKDV